MLIGLATHREGRAVGSRSAARRGPRGGCERARARKVYLDGRRRIGSLDRCTNVT